MKQLSLEAFADACGGQGPFCLDVAPVDGGAAQRQVLKQPFALLGRHERADVCLNGAGVSRRHALLQLIAGRVFCLDLDSRTGTHWDGGGGGHGWLAGHSPFRVGPYWLSFADPVQRIRRAAPDDWDPWARGSLSGRELPSCTLNILNDGSTVCKWRMNRVLAVVGSANVCKVRLRGPGVSRLHCSLVVTPVGVWVIDLQRQGGTKVNGTLISHSLLEDGDRLQVGNYTICLSYDFPSSQARTAAISAHAGNVALSSDRMDGHATGDLPARLFGAAPDARLSRNSEAAMAPSSAPSSLGGTGGAFLGETANAELLSSLLRQFSQMQHQMFDQSMVMMFQMFRAMHVEQVDDLREELARLDELNQELRALLTERLKLPAPAQGPPTGKVAGPTSTQRTPTLNGLVASEATKKEPTAAAGVRAADASSADSPRVSRDASRPVIPPASPSAAASGADVHAWLCQRMETIQQERQGLWDRIVGVVGKKQ